MLWRKKKKRVLGIGLDGMPHSLFLRLAEDGHIPNLKRLADANHLKRMNSVYPTVSSVAWSSFSSGTNPGGHGIYGFVDRTPGTYDIFIPTASNKVSDCVWDHLGRAHKRSVVINIPVTYPPKDINGVLIAGFLCTNIDKVTTTSRLIPKLKEMGYVIDVDAYKAQKEKSALMDELFNAVRRRGEAARYLMETEDWDFFFCHFMETDRLYHFFWDEYASSDPTFGPKFYEFHRALDEEVGKLVEMAGDGVELIILSDHGFCRIKKEVQLNKWLQDEGYMTLRPDFDPKKQLNNIDPQDTRAFSLIPGRIFLNLEGREPGGTVAPGDEAKALLQEIAARAKELKDPDTGEPIIDKVFYRDEIYSGPAVDRAADLIVHPYDGYDIKGTIKADSLTRREHLEGMHTYDDALLLTTQEMDLGPRNDISGIMGHILAMLGAS
jgi:predicted AlkP superfamily phosphohydrolase/phosphomutase